MDDYCLSNGFSFDGKSALKHFQLVENQLKNDENVIMAMTTSGIYDGAQIVMGGITAIAFTNKRLIYAQKGGFLFGEQIKIVNLDKINDIQKEPFGLFYGKIKIDTIKENIGIQVDKKIIDLVFRSITEFIDNYKNGPANNTVVQQISGADELKKFKDLLDSGIISNEEFEAKKKQILGL